MTFHDKHLRAEFSGRSRTTQLAGWAKSPQVVTHQLLRTPPPPHEVGKLAPPLGHQAGSGAAALNQPWASSSKTMELWCPQASGRPVGLPGG